MMADPVVISLIGAATTVLISVINLIAVILSHERGKRNEVTLTQTKEALVAIKEQTNGIQANLVKVTAEAEYAKGLKKGEELPRG